VTATLPRLVLVHGAWHGAWAWERLLPILAQRGWEASAIDLPSAGSTAGLREDAERLQAALRDHPGPTVLVGHSYGGTVITQGGAGMDDVVGLVYLCAAKPDVGDVVWSDPRSPSEVPPWIEVDFDRAAIHAHRSETILYNDCAPDVLAAARARLRPQSLASFLEPVTAASWHDHPTAYLICELDNCVPVAAQEEIAQGAGRIERLAAGHSPFMSRPGEVEAFLRRAVLEFLEGM
jgi:pimeloyl-ACP methyl ester carboxylesterase